MKIKYVSKKKLYPAFGQAILKANTIYIRKDLPKIVQKYLYWHETFHIRDGKRLKKKGKNEHWVCSEIKANIYGFLKQPLGATITLLMSLTPSRLKLYYRRFKEGW